MRRTPYAVRRGAMRPATAKWLCCGRQPQRVGLRGRLVWWDARHCWLRRCGRVCGRGGVPGAVGTSTGGGYYTRVGQQ